MRKCAEDFLQIRRKFQNVDLEECVEEITEYIRQA